MAAVDVITPVFNTPQRFLAAALNSLREQTFTDWNAWIVNDASEKAYTAELEETLKAYGDPRIHYVYSDHRGPAGSRNVGIAKGIAPFVALLDSDDCWMPHHLSRQVPILEADARLALGHGNCEWIDTDGHRIRSITPNTSLNDLSNPQLFVAMLRENFVCASSVVMRRNILEQVGGFDETFPCLVDKELWLRILSIGAEFHYDPDVVVQYRVHPDNISKKTDLLLATRRRLIDKVPHLASSKALLADIEWPALKREMTRHMYREAAAAHLEQGRFARALRYSSPFYAGVSRDSCLLFLRSLYRLLGIRGNRAGTCANF